MKKFFVFLVAAIIPILSLAQGKETVQHEFARFSTIVAEDNFDISFIDDSSCIVRYEADEEILDYVQTYVLRDVLYLKIDKKSMPKEVKKEYNSKNNGRFRIKIQISAANVSSICIEGDSELNSKVALNVDKFSLQASKKAIVRNLDVVAATSAVVDIQGRASVKMGIKTQSLDLNSTNNAQGDFKVELSKLTVDAKSYSKLEITGTASKIKLYTQGNAQVEFNTVETVK